MLKFRQFQTSKAPTISIKSYIAFKFPLPTPPPCNPGHSQPSQRGSNIYWNLLSTFLKLLSIKHVLSVPLNQQLDA